MASYTATINIPDISPAPAGKIGPNLIFNPRGQIFQKGPAMPAPAAIGGYQCDYWGHRGYGSKVFVEQRPVPLGDPLAQRYVMRMTWASVAGPSNYSLIACDIDDVRNYAGSKCTLSLRIRADQNRNICLEHNQHFGEGGASPEWTGAPITIPVTTEFQDIHIPIDDWPSVAGKILGSSETDTDRIGIVLFCEAGSNFNARTNNLGQSSGWIEIARMELREDVNDEIVTMADPWSVYDEEAELLRCQSLLEVFDKTEVLWSGYVESGKYRWIGLPFKVTKRRYPVITLSNITAVGFGAVTCPLTTKTGLQIAGLGNATINSGYFQANVIVDANHPYTP